MKTKKSLEDRIRGWLPKELELPSQSSQIQRSTQQKPTPVHKLSRLWPIIIMGLASVVFDLTIDIGFSTIQIVLIMTILAFGITLVFTIRRNQKIRKYLKICLFFVLAIALSFNGLGLYFFRTSGYPPVYAPQLGYSNMLNASLTGYFQSVEQSQTFCFLQTEHLGTVSFFGLTMWPSVTSNFTDHQFVIWRLYAKDTNNYITMESYAGEHYYTGSDNPFQFQPPPNNFPTSQMIKRSFEEIDALGLNWFSTRTIVLYHNQTGLDPKINVVEMDINFDAQNNYQGITVQVSFGLGNITTENGTKLAFFEAQFEPNGTLLSFT